MNANPSKDERIFQFLWNCLTGREGYVMAGWFLGSALMLVVPAVAWASWMVNR